MGLFDQRNAPYLMNVGMGLLQAAQPQPYGQNRMSLIANSINQANQQAMQSKMFNAQMEQAEEEKKQRNSMMGARATLLGGRDPNTGIDWETGRQGMEEGERMSLMMRAWPEQMGKGLADSMFASGKPTDADRLVGLGVPRDVAEKIDTGAYKIVPNETGQSTVVDLSSMQQVWPPAQSGAMKTPMTPPLDVENASGAYGGSGVMTNLANTVTGMFGVPNFFPDQEEARGGIDALKTYTGLALSQEFADRDTNMVREMVLDLIPDPGSLTIGDERARTRFTKVVDLLKADQDKKMAIVNNPGNYRPVDVANARKGVLQLNALIGMYQNVLQKWDGDDLMDGLTVEEIK